MFLKFSLSYRFFTLCVQFAISYRTDIKKRSDVIKIRFILFTLQNPAILTGVCRLIDFTGGSITVGDSIGQTSYLIDSESYQSVSIEHKVPSTCGSVGNILKCYSNTFGNFLACMI